MAATLLYIEAFMRLRGRQTCTQLSNNWILPAHVPAVFCSPISNIMFTSASVMKRKIDERIGQACGNSQQVNNDIDSLAVKRNAATVATKLTASEVCLFHEILSKCDTKPAILSLVSPYNDSFVNEKLVVQAFTSFFSRDNMNLSFEELLNMGEQQNISITEHQVLHIEALTRQQSKQIKWYNARSRRITASNLSAACKTKVTEPSVSLLKRIASEVNTFQDRCNCLGLRARKACFGNV